MKRIGEQRDRHSIYRRFGRAVFSALAILTFSMLSPGLAVAQTIAGVVKDATGAMLPGVTVEASSSALIEKTRVAVTDGDGQYRIVTLPIGTYTVSASLPGFSASRREGIVLTTGFTATINLELRIGEIQETVTVTGDSPVVDVQSATRQEQISLKEVDELPTGRSVPSIGKILPGLIPARLDVGGSEGFQSVGLTAHGSKSNQGVTQIDGMAVASAISSGNTVPYFNIGEMEEFTFQTSALPAEVAVGGVRTSLTPKEGGNAFSGFVVGQLANWQSNNYTDTLRQRGLAQPNQILEIWDQNYGLGGPIMKDRLWFYSSFRQWGVNYLAANARYHPSSLALCNEDWGTTERERKYDCQGIDDNNAKSAVLRLTWQATPKHKINVSYAPDKRFRGHEDIAPGISPESTTAQLVNTSYHAHAKWVAPITSRLLLEAGWSKLVNNYDQDAQPPVRSEPNRTRVDLLRGEQWGPWASGFFNRDAEKSFYVGSVSYVTGSHAFKTGVQYGRGREDSFRDRYLGHVVQEYRNGVPASVTVDNTPIKNQPRHKDLGLYAQDSWTMGRTTLNLGLRYDYFNAWTPEQTAPASRWVPARTFAPITDLTTFHDISPRFNLAHDVFGDGKTALKVSVGRHVASLGNSFVDTYNPSFQDTERRNWSDCDYIPGTSTCSGRSLPTNGDDLAQDNEVGPSSRATFGTRAPRRPDENLQRATDWEYAASIQRELLPRVSATFGFFRRVFMDLPKADNVLISAADYTAVTIPDPRGTGEPITVYNLNRSKLGLSDIVDTYSKENREYWQGVELTVNGRMGGRSTFFGGITLGGASQNRCEASDDPNELRYCERSEPWRAQLKFGGTYMLPLRFNVSGTFLSLAGAAAGANYNVNRSIIPTLTQSQVVVALDDPSNPDVYLDRNNQLDLRIARTFRIRGTQLTPQVDVYNALNSNTVQQILRTYGPNFGQARSIIQGRLFQIGGQFRF
jgi:hypothetical protein